MCLLLTHHELLMHFLQGELGQDLIEYALLGTIVAMRSLAIKLGNALTTLELLPSATVSAFVVCGRGGRRIRRLNQPQYCTSLLDVEACGRPLSPLAHGTPNA